MTSNCVSSHGRTMISDVPSSVHYVLVLFFSNYVRHFTIFSVAVSIYIVLQDLLSNDYYIADMDKMLIKSEFVNVPF